MATGRSSAPPSTRRRSGAARARRSPRSGTSSVRCSSRPCGRPPTYLDIQSSASARPERLWSHEGSSPPGPWLAHRRVRIVTPELTRPRPGPTFKARPPAVPPDARRQARDISTSEIHMLRLFSLLLAVQQAPAQAPPASAPPSPVARLAITPSSRSMTAGDTLRLTAQALDSSGRAIPNAEIRFMQAGAGFEASVNAEGLVTSGATGTVPVSVFALVPGTRPYVERVEIRMLPGPAARIEVSPAVQRLVTGQRVRLSASSYSS